METQSETPSFICDETHDDDVVCDCGEHFIHIDDAHILPHSSSRDRQDREM